MALLLDDLGRNVLGRAAECAGSALCARARDAALG